MNLVPHTALSGAIGLGLWGVTREPITFPAALAAGVLPDLDHLLDFYNWYVRRDHQHLILFLHAWEYLVGAILIYLFVVSEPWMLAVVLGYAGQIGADQLCNHPFPHTYSIVGRALVGFDRKRVSRTGVSEAYKAVLVNVPFGRNRLRRWFEARARPQEASQVSGPRASRGP